MLIFAQTDNMRKHGLQSPDKPDNRTCPVSAFYKAFIEPERLGDSLFEIASELAATRPELFGFSRAPQVWEYNVAASSMFDGGHLR